MNAISIAFDTKAGTLVAHRAMRLVLHADDFGMSVSINQGIIAGFSAGLLTSTSILANAPAAKQAAVAWRILDLERTAGRISSLGVRSRLNDFGAPFDLGVHLNLTQGRPLTGGLYPPQLLDGEGRFPGVFPLMARLATSGSRYQQAIRAELSRQVEFVLDEGLPVSHLNGHQYVEMLPVVSGIVPDLLARYSIRVVRVARERGLVTTTLRRSFRPTQWALAQVKRVFAASYLRRIDRCGTSHPRDYFGTAHAGTIDLRAMQSFVALIRGGMTEIGIHPGMADEHAASPRADGWNDPLATLRPRELELLCSNELANVLARRKVSLARLSDLRGAAAIRRAA